MITYTSGETVSVWMLERLPCVKRWMDQYVTFGVCIDGELKAGVVFDQYTGSDICMHVVVEDRRAVTREALKAAFSFPFVTLGCQRVTGLVPARNVKARRFDEGLGFVLEGIKKQAFEDGEDELIFGMLKEDCRWL